MDWQPIETAPKDGTIIDLWSGSERLAKCRWREDPIAIPGDDNSGWEQAYSEVFDCWFPLYDHDDVSHWMPLPDPPE